MEIMGYRGMVGSTYGSVTTFTTHVQVRSIICTKLPESHLNFPGAFKLSLARVYKLIYFIHKILDPLLLPMFGFEAAAKHEKKSGNRSTFE